MELRHLRYFSMLAAERNFTRAAEKLNIAQPPLSRQIKQLEENLGVELFVRGARPLELTEAGRLLYEHAVQVLERVDDIRTTVRAIGRRSVAYPIGFVGSTIYGTLPQTLRAFRLAHPELDMRLIEMTTIEQISALRERRIAIGFGRLRFEEPAIDQLILRDEPLAACLRDPPPELECDDAVALADLMTAPLIIYPRKPRPSYADQVLTLLRARDLRPAALIEAGELQTALGLVAAGVGNCLVPEPASRLRNDIAVRAIDDAAVTSPVIASSRAGERDDATLALLAMFKSPGTSDGRE